MKQSQIPVKIPQPFGANAGADYIRSIPNSSQIGVDNGAASFNDGFPPDCFVPQSAGGYPPDGRDMNGLLNVVTAWAQWTAAAGLTFYDSAFQTTIGGYPKAAVLIKADLSGLWVSTVDDNTTNPDTEGAGWSTIGSNPSGNVPVGCLYIDTIGAQSPAQILGFGTWLEIGKGRVLVGLDPQDENFAEMGQTGGEDTHVLTQSELPEVDLAVTGGGRWGATGVNADGSAALAGEAGASNISTFNITAPLGGSNTPHNNLQPYLVVRMWTRTA